MLSSNSTFLKSVQNNSTFEKSTQNNRTFLKSTQNNTSTFEKSTQNCPSILYFIIAISLLFIFNYVRSIWVCKI